MDNWWQIYFVWLNKLAFLIEDNHMLLSKIGVNEPEVSLSKNKKQTEGTDMTKSHVVKSLILGSYIIRSIKRLATLQ